MFQKLFPAITALDLSGEKVFPQPMFTFHHLQPVSRQLNMLTNVMQLTTACFSTQCATSHTKHDMPVPHAFLLGDNLFCHRRTWNSVSHLAKPLLNGVLFHVLAMPNTDIQQQINQSQSTTLDDMLVNCLFTS